MIIALMKTECKSCKQLANFFSTNNIFYNNYNIGYKPIKEEYLIKMDDFIPEGIKGVINLNSQKFIDSKIDVDKIQRKYLIDFIIENPDVLYLPIVFELNNQENINKLLVGFNEKKVGIFSNDTFIDSFYDNVSKMFNSKYCCIYCDIEKLRK